MIYKNEAFIDSQKYMYPKPSLEVYRSTDNLKWLELLKNKYEKYYGMWITSIKKKKKYLL